MAVQTQPFFSKLSGILTKNELLSFLNSHNTRHKHLLLFIKLQMFSSIFSSYSKREWEIFKDINEEQIQRAR